MAHLERELERARRASATSLEEAARTIEAQSKSAGAELAQRAVALARTLAEKILGRKIAA
jgi:F0F1-type ATP synthase membrane subunit b/b'